MLIVSKQLYCLYVSTESRKKSNIVKQNDRTNLCIDQVTEKYINKLALINAELITNQDCSCRQVCSIVHALFERIRNVT